MSLAYGGKASLRTAELDGVPKQRIMSVVLCDLYLRRIAYGDILIASGRME